MNKSASTLGFGEYLRKLRTERGLTLKNVAEFMKWSVVYQSDLELGRKNPLSFDRLNTMNGLFNFSTEELDTLIFLSSISVDKIELNMPKENEKKYDLAFALARSWEKLSEKQINKIKGVLDEDA